MSLISLAFVRTAVAAVTLNVAAALIVSSVAYADPHCHRVDAYWNTNVSKLVENINECDKKSWQNCSQAAAIHYDLKAGSLFQRAKACGLTKSIPQAFDVTSHKDTDSTKCMHDRDTLRATYEVRSQARIACANARAGGDNQEWLDSQCAYFRSQMANYHTPFRNMAQSCQINYREVLALR